MRIGERESSRRLDQLCDLEGVEGSALPQVVVADEERKAPTPGRAFVGADAADKAGILPGCLQWRRDFAQLDTRSVAEQLVGPRH